MSNLSQHRIRPPVLSSCIWSCCNNYLDRRPCRKKKKIGFLERKSETFVNLLRYWNHGIPLLCAVFRTNIFMKIFPRYNFPQTDPQRNLLILLVVGLGVHTNSLRNAIWVSSSNFLLILWVYTALTSWYPLQLTFIFTRQNAEWIASSKQPDKYLLLNKTDQYGSLSISNRISISCSVSALLHCNEWSPQNLRK